MYHIRFASGMCAQEPWMDGVRGDLCIALPLEMWRSNSGRV